MYITGAICIGIVLVVYFKLHSFLSYSVSLPIIFLYHASIIGLEGKLDLNLMDALGKPWFAYSELLTDHTVWWIEAEIAWYDAKNNVFEYFVLNYLPALGNWKYALLLQVWSRRKPTRFIEAFSYEARVILSIQLWVGLIISNRFEQ